MLVRLALLALLCALVADADAQWWGVPLNCVAVDQHGECVLYGISMVELLANPPKYDGKQIRLAGYLHFESEDTAIYLHKDDAEHHLLKNGIWVSLLKGASLDGCQDSYVVIEGLYKASNTGHMRSWSGAVTRVTSCRKLP